MNIYDALILKAVGGGGGTTVVANPEGEATDELEKLQVGSDIYGISKDYEEMSNKPQINSVELDGNKTASELGLQAELDGAQTVSGNPITVADAEPMNAESVKVELEPKQDLHGYDAPWVGGAGKNKFDVSQYDRGYFTRSNETLTNTLTDTKSQLNLALWTDISNVQTTNLINENIAENGTYSYTFTVNEPSVDSLVLKHNGSIRDLIISDFPWTPQGTFTLSLTVEGHDPSTVGGLVISNIQIEQGQTATSYAPYTNICPITGYSEVNVERVGKNWCPYDKITTNASGYFTLASGGYTFSFKCLGTPKYSTSKIILRDANNNDLVFVPYTVTPVGSYLSGTFTISESTSCQILNENVNVDSSGYAIDNIQIESGNERTTYEPYQGSTATIDLDGTKYGGTLDVTEGGYSDEWGTHTLDYVTLEDGLFTASAPTSVKADVFAQAKCNRMKTWASVDDLDDNYGIAYLNNTFYMKLPPECGTTASEVDDWLGENPVRVAYIKKTPSSISTTPTDIPLLENTNNVSTDGTNIQLKYQPNNVIGECKVYTDEQIEKHNPLNYSTDEKAVGTWIDGKTIYQKTVEFGQTITLDNPSGGTDITQYMQGMYEVVDKFVGAFGTRVYSNAYLPLYIQKFNSAIGIWRTIEVDTSIDAITVQYTKS